MRSALERVRVVDAQGVPIDATYFASVATERLVRPTEVAFVWERST